MHRRKFLTSLAATIGGVALTEAIPFDRVWSFPSKIVIRKGAMDIRLIKAFSNAGINFPIRCPQRYAVIDLAEIDRQYREGVMGRTTGFDWYDGPHEKI